jgi:UDPglucose 6-dehydrogenase
MALQSIRQIAVVGLGYVGFVTSLCLASKGYSVIGVDNVTEVVEGANRGKIPFFEPELGELLKSALDKQQFFAIAKYSEAIKASDLIFITVGTPADAKGAIDLRYIKQAAHDIGANLDPKYRIVIVKSTVIPGTTDSVILPILESESHLKAGVSFGLCMNPEFLKEGNAVQDFLHPDRTIIGSLDSASANLLEQLFVPFGAPIFKTNLRTAEMIKYANNAFLATKVSFINEIANICRLIEGVDVKDLAYGIGLDYRINQHFLRAGCGFGGSCFPKDLQELIFFAKDRHYAPMLLEATLQVNDFQAQIMIDLAISAIGSLAQKKIAVLGLAFKPNTSDMREAASVRIINKLLNLKPNQIAVYDPAAISEAQKIFGAKVIYCNSAKDCLKNAHICFIITEWDEFKTFKPEFFKSLMKTPIIIDGRKIYDIASFSKETTIMQIGYKQAS